MTIADRWLLPDGIDEILPPKARQVETLRREMLDLFDRWGYELVMPPHLEFMESLTAGLGRDLELQTFKVTDQLTGRMMGLRADTTPAAARIDAHTIVHTGAGKGPTRLCYAGSVFHARPASLGASRSPIQLGAELFGHPGIESDIEVISLMLETLAAVGVDSVSLDLGHVQIYRSLAHHAGLDESKEQVLFDALQRKAASEVQTLVEEWSLEDSLAKMFLALATLSGGFEVIKQARTVLGPTLGRVSQALDQLECIAQQLSTRYPNVELYFDLGELRGYNYHTGVVFAAYLVGRGQAIAKGGRYDGIGQAFGRNRSATGFSTDLKLLLDLKPGNEVVRATVFAPVEVEPAVVQELRRQGKRVVSQLPGQETDGADMGCVQHLVCRDGEWVVVSVPGSP